MRRRVTIDMRMLRASGIGSYLANLVPRLLGHLPEFDFTILGNRNEIELLIGQIPDNVRIVDIDCGIYSIAEQLRIPKAIPDDSDLLWVPHFNIPLRYWGKLLVTVHDLFHLAMPHLSGNFWKRFFVRGLFNSIRDRADYVLFDSDFTRSEFRRLVGEPKKESAVVGCGVDESWFRTKAGSSSSGRPYIISAGNIKPHKNVRLLIELFVESRWSTEYDLLLVGKKEGFRGGDDEVVKLIESHKNCIRATGFISDGELQDYVANAACLVHPSLYEGFGLPPLEAMAAGTPVLASSAASIPEVCGDGALYFDPYNRNDLAKQLRVILEDDSLRNDLIAKGLARARQYSWEQSAERIAGIVRTLLK